jgi:hypothetical protein
MKSRNKNFLNTVIIVISIIGIVTDIALLRMAKKRNLK